MDKLDPDEKHKIATLNREKRDAQDGIGWMYKGIKPDAEEYLLGKRLDKFIEGEEEKKDEASVIFGERIKANIALDMAAKMREDPLFAIRRKEEESRKKLLENPVKMKELQKLIEQQQKLKEKKKKSKKKNKKHKKSKNSDDSDDDIMTKYLSILTSKHHKDESSHKDESNHKKKRHHQSKYSSHDDESGEEDLNRHRQDKRSCSTDRHSDTTQNRKTREDSESNRRLYSRGNEVKHKYQHKDSLTDRNKSASNNYSPVRERLKRDDSQGSRTNNRNIDSDVGDDRERKRKDNKMGIRENKKYRNNKDSSASDDSRTKSPEKASKRRDDKNLHKTVDTYKDRKEFTEKRSGRTQKAKGRTSESQVQREAFISDDSNSSDAESPTTGYLKNPEKNGKAKTRLKTKRRHRSSSSSSTSVERSDHEEKKVVSGSRQYGLIVSSSSQAVAKPRQRSPSPVQTSYKTSSVRTTQTRRAPSPPRRKLTAEEKQRKLEEMSQNAVWREEQRESNVKRYREEEQQREQNEARPKEGGFLSSMMIKHASSSSVEDRLRRNKYNIQRTQVDLDKNFTQK